MKKIAFTFLVLFTTFGVQAQTIVKDSINYPTMTIVRNNGQSIIYNVKDLEQVDFNQYTYIEKQVNEEAGITPEIYTKEPSESEVDNAINTLKEGGYLGQNLAGQYNLRGGKEGGLPAAHAYQRQYSFGPDLYAQYFTIPHKDFMYGTITSTYDVSSEFKGASFIAYTMAKDNFMPLLHHPSVNSIPEIKAINLLYYCLAAQEHADLAGPYTYMDDKTNASNSTVYNDLRTIYYEIVEDLDAIVACLNYYQTEGNRPDWYKKKIGDLMMRYHQTGREPITGDCSNLSSFIKLANSLKLRMAMHIVKVEPETAKHWAEEAVASGVVESVDEQHGLYPIICGFRHPLCDIACSWGDLRLSASFESLLVSLNHPYTKYFIQPNNTDITNPYTGEVLPKGTRICGIRSGQFVGDGQVAAVNPLQAYSIFDYNRFDGGLAPMYFLKWAEVDLLRAEGAIRGWNMGGTAKDFYERAIRNAYFEDPILVQHGVAYADHVEDYLNLEEPVDYISVDPLGAGEPWPSVTKIGVKWNEGDNLETKLEKIITQKYLALFPLSTEAWTELRRTGYPKLFPVLNTNDGDGSIEQGDMIRRIPWLPTDAVTKILVNERGVPALGGPDKQATRLWWDVDAPNF